MTIIDLLDASENSLTMRGSSANESERAIGPW